MVTSPIGLWDYEQLIGASVKIGSLPVYRGIFGLDSDSKYVIEDIKFKMTSTGISICQVFLEGIESPFEWKDLEITGLDMTLYGDAICGCFCCGGTLCGYGSSEYGGEEKPESSSSTSSGECSCTDGPVLD